ncbi:hypothetical protein RFI_24666 [Reticulomyxa filosa]|uniref:JmjC domain-containing protein n=1 Tax=Reticulomyxa filosa TaxID=46433 RepID=X6MI22_RETFI|nr:hypothetical protein RFI_24666 [Reticulomyxa filosa]|eukprot:ETO12710.1 hypothetical protein RFI_24666 [Reticulomyxa filosa]
MHAILTEDYWTNSQLFDCLYSFRMKPLNQTFFHIVAKSRASGFTRVLTHLPQSAALLRHLQIHADVPTASKSEVASTMNWRQVDIKKWTDIVDLRLFINALIQVNMPSEWYIQPDTYGHTAIDFYWMRLVSMRQHIRLWDWICRSHVVFMEGFAAPKADSDSDYCCNVEWYLKEHLKLLFPTNHRFFDLSSSSGPLSIPSINRDVYAGNGIKAVQNVWQTQKPFIFSQQLQHVWNYSLQELSMLCGTTYKFEVNTIPYHSLYVSTNPQKTEPNQNHKRSEKLTMEEFIKQKFQSPTKFQLQYNVSNGIKSIQCLGTSHNNHQSLDYIFDAQLLQINQQLQQALNVSALIEQTLFLKEYHINLLQFAMGNKGTGANMHFHGPALNILMHGKKLWLLLPPKFAFHSLLNAHDLFCHLVQEKNFAKSQKWRKTNEYLLLEQNVGDIVFVPHEWAHAVINVEPSIAVAVELAL